MKNRVGDGQFEILCRYYITPEHTHLGRQVRGWEGCGMGDGEGEEARRGARRGCITRVFQSAGGVGGGMRLTDEGCIHPNTALSPH